ncbi:hypothetical protein RNJ44_03512 [Nakaseomyces bracarensis]|uniref:cAMP-dependent protein kinase regulatory subunit n=1 Tax=Nakaseomyces bracarensis TaxID=273131 RepID=A0ABR4NXA5_9SACH
MVSDECRSGIAAFQNAVNEANPDDFLQFGSNYFHQKLEEQRKMGRRSVSGFKSPFASGDPHSKDIPHDPHHSGHHHHEHNNSHSGEGSGSLFKGSFGSGSSGPFSTGDDPKSKNQEMDPRAGHADEDKKKIPNNFNAMRRTSVSGETLQPDHFDDWQPEHYQEKSEEQLKRLEKSIGKNFLFNKLDSDSKKLVINCLEEKKVSKGTEIIKQGDEGDYFYVVESGTVEFYVNDQKVNTSGAGSSFGELALMYNSPRAATVLAQTDCTLWALDRLTFRKILLGSSFKKRLMYDDLLKNMDVLKSLTTYDRAKLADALDTKIYEAGEVIIKEGDRAENFYLIEYGACDVIKENIGVVAKLKDHDYFGEVALLNDLPRQATVTATKKTKVATLGKSGFQRLLGPAVEVLKLNDPTKKH